MHTNAYVVSHTTMCSIAVKVLNIHVYVKHKFITTYFYTFKDLLKITHKCFALLHEAENNLCESAKNICILKDSSL